MRTHDWVIYFITELNLMKNANKDRQYRKDIAILKRNIRDFIRQVRGLTTMEKVHGHRPWYYNTYCACLAPDRLFEFKSLKDSMTLGFNLPWLTIGLPKGTPVTFINIQSLVEQYNIQLRFIGNLVYAPPYTRKGDHRYDEWVAVPVRLVCDYKECLVPSFELGIHTTNTYQHDGMAFPLFSIKVAAKIYGYDCTAFYIDHFDLHYKYSK